MPRWYPDSQRQSPIMRPDWRWQRAASLVCAGRSASRKRDDEETCRAVAFLRHQQRVVTETASRRLMKRFPDIVLALKLHQGPPLRRHEIECRVLGRQPARLIAELMQVPVHLVRAYKSLFFAIDDRIDADSYITREVIGISGTGPAPAHQWAKWAAYQYGPHMIEPWLDYLDHQGESHDLTTIEGWRRDSIDIFLRVRNLQIDGPAAAKALQCLRFIGDLPKISAYQSVSAIFRERMTQAIDQIPWPVGVADTGSTASPPNRRVHKPKSYDDLKNRPREERLRTA